MTKYQFIYKTTNLVNGKFYVGKHSTDNLNDGYLGSGNFLKKAIKKNGRKNFKREILEKCLPCKFYINEKEKYWIKKLDAVKRGYNLTNGGDGMLGFEYTVEQRLERSKRVSGKINPNYGKSGNLNPNYGNIYSEESRERIRKARIGKGTFSKQQKIEHSKRMSGDRNPMFGKKGKDAPFYGKTHSKETLEIIRQTHTGKIVSEETREKQRKAKQGKKSSEETIIKLKNKRKIECEYCSKIVDISNYGRWHGNNCKFKKEVA